MTCLFLKTNKQTKPIKFTTHQWSGTSWKLCKLTFFFVVVNKKDALFTFLRIPGCRKKIKSWLFLQMLLTFSNFSSCWNGHFWERDHFWIELQLGLFVFKQRLKCELKQAISEAVLSRDVCVNIFMHRYSKFLSAQAAKTYNKSWEKPIKMMRSFFALVLFSNSFMHFSHMFVKISQVSVLNVWGFF